MLLVCHRTIDPPGHVFAMMVDRSGWLVQESDAELLRRRGFVCPRAPNILPYRAPKPAFKDKLKSSATCSFVYSGTVYNGGIRSIKYGVLGICSIILRTREPKPRIFLGVFST